MLDRLTFDDFKPLEDSLFRATEHDVDLRLESVRQVMESERARLARQPFSLYFRGPIEPHLPQGTYTLSHTAFAEPLAIFLVPVGRNSEGFEYEAIFT